MKTRNSKIAALVLEELGKLNTRAGRGYGTASPIYVKPVKGILGDTDEEHHEKKIEDKKPVRISRAFLKRKDS
tara:strand:- start:974 stop:1192 length:219 start_codon:yes stop_codon:yes gene_type:complete